MCKFEKKLKDLKNSIILNKTLIVLIFFDNIIGIYNYI